MTIKVVVEEEETLSAALRRLRGEVWREISRNWGKPRPGAYEKPSYRRRQSNGLRERNRRGRRPGRTVLIHMRDLFSRLRPFESAERYFLRRLRANHRDCQRRNFREL